MAKEFIPQTAKNSTSEISVQDFLTSKHGLFWQGFFFCLLYLYVTREKTHTNALMYNFKVFEMQNHMI